MKRHVLSLLMLVLAGFAGRVAEPTPSERRQAGQQRSVQEINDQFARQISASIAGHESEPAEKVFKNIQWLKGTPAGTLLVIMNAGYAKALGVSCTHCHAEDDFSRDDKRPKRAAREMAVMHRSINQQLRGMKELTSDAQSRAINCSTCHRGAIDPMRAPGGG